MISMMLRLMFPPWRGVTTNPRILEGINPTKRFAKGKETTHQSSAIQDDRREAISKVVHVTMVEKAHSLYSIRNSELYKHPRLSITLSLVYGSKVVIPIEISVETKRVQDFYFKENEKRRQEDLDVLEERREMAAIKEAHYKQKLEGYYNKNVKPSTFKPGTYVLQLNNASKAEYQGKMRLMWEGPYRVRKAYGDGAYKLETLFGKAIDRTWNGTNLLKFYV
ncbi:hypothetical protein Tco_1371718 [Tanacetum coccineum]